jgi:hypothetical protein
MVTASAHISLVSPSLHLRAAMRDMFEVAVCPRARAFMPTFFA